MTLSLREATSNQGHFWATPLQETLKHSQGGLTQSLVRSLLLSGVHKILFVPSKSLFPLVLWKFYNQILLSFKVSFPGGSLCWIPVSIPDVRPRTFAAVWELLCYYSPFWESPTCRYGIWFWRDYIPPASSLQLRLCPWTQDIFFFLVSSSILSGVVQQLVALLVFSWEKMGACPFTLPSFLWW